MDAAELRRTLVLANEFKEGDLALGGTRDDQLRAQARSAVLATTLLDLRTTRLVDDGVSDALARSLDPALASAIDSLTIAQVKDILLGPGASAWVQRYRSGLSSEAIAACAKVMSNAELSTVARTMFNPLPGDGVAVGSPGHFGARIQPNSPGDDDDEILFSILEGLSYGCGDVVLGLNPASDDVDTIVRLEQLLQQVVARLGLPTRYCVLSDIVKQQRAREHTAVDVGFQSLAGTSRALAGMVGLDVDGLLDVTRGFSALYFETGQGSAVTNGADEGVDMVTLESRAYGVARVLGQRTGKWMIVNDVAGFIGPEVFALPVQLERACLEDVTMSKLHGLTMGLDVCSTFHMGISPDELRTLTHSIVEQGAPAYLMAVAGNADPMLGYMTTSFREHPRLRAHSGRSVASAFQQRLRSLGVMDDSGRPSGSEDATAGLYAIYAKGGGDTRSADSLRDDARSKLKGLQERGFDLAYGCGAGFADPPASDARLQRIFSHARQALYSRVDDGVIRDVAPRCVRVATRASGRDDYLQHPPNGELIRDTDTATIRTAPRVRVPQVQFVLSDGLNADALNEHARTVVPPLRRQLGSTGFDVCEVDVVIENGRVRAGYHVGALVGPTVIVHMIGERPGTGINTLSAYITYGFDPAGQPRWSPSLDHSCTSAVCGIHPDGKPPAAAVDEIARLVARMIQERRSGVALSGRAS